MREKLKLFNVTPKVNKYIGIIFFTYFIIWFWIINHSFSLSHFIIQAKWSFPESQSYVWQLLHNVSYLPVGWTDELWWISLMFSIYCGWEFKHIPMKVIYKMEKTFDKYVWSINLYFGLSQAAPFTNTECNNLLKEEIKTDYFLLK